ARTSARSEGSQRCAVASRGRQRRFCAAEPERLAGKGSGDGAGRALCWQRQARMLAATGAARHPRSFKHPFLPLSRLRHPGPAADRVLFDSARRAARSAMAEILEKVLPEYWETVRPQNPVGANAPVTPVSAPALTKVLYSSRTYSLPLLLMALEFYFAGGLEE